MHCETLQTQSFPKAARDLMKCERYYAMVYLSENGEISVNWNLIKSVEKMQLIEWVVKAHKTKNWTLMSVIADHNWKFDPWAFATVWVE